MNRLSIGAGLVLLVFALPATAAPEIYQYRFKNEIAYVSFDKQEDCIYTHVEVHGYANIIRDEPSSLNASPSALITYSIYNACTDEYREGGGMSDAVSFRADKSLQSASLTGTILIEESPNNSERTIEIQLQWVGKGSRIHDISRDRYHSPAYTFNSRTSGTTRDADISGNIWLDGNSLLNANGLTERSLDYYARLSSNNSGTIEIQKR